MTPNEARWSIGLPARADDPVTRIPKRLRFYRTHGGYYALRIGRRWLYWHAGGLRFSQYANAVGKGWKPKEGEGRDQ